jgi:hypothetical protein
MPTLLRSHRHVSKAASGELEVLTRREGRQLQAYVIGRGGFHAREAVAAKGPELPPTEGCAPVAGLVSAGLDGCGPSAPAAGRRRPGSGPPP